MNNALKFLLLAAGCAVAILLITVGVKMANKGKGDVDGNLEQYSEAASTYQDIDMKVYEGTIILGSEVKRIINTYNEDDYLSVVVDTMKGVSTSYINTCAAAGVTVATNSGIDYSSLTSDKKNPDYINEAGKFLCKVIYDGNNVVECIWFEQQ